MFPRSRWSCLSVRMPRCALPLIPTGLVPTLRIACTGDAAGRFVFRRSAHDREPGPHRSEMDFRGSEEMKNSPRRAIWLIALCLAIAGLIATPREGAAFKIAWLDKGPWNPWETGDPNTPDGGRAREVTPGLWSLIPVQTPFGFLEFHSVPTRGMGHTTRAASTSRVTRRP